MIGFFTSTKPGRAKEHNGVLDMFASDAREGLHVLRNDANQATVRAVEESGIFVGERRDFERGRCAVGWKSGDWNWHFYLRIHGGYRVRGLFPIPFSRIPAFRSLLFGAHTLIHFDAGWRLAQLSRYSAILVLR